MTFDDFRRKHPYRLDLDGGDCHVRFASLGVAAASAVTRHLAVVDEQTGQEHSFEECVKIAPTALRMIPQSHIRPVHTVVEMQHDAASPGPGPQEAT